MASIIVPVSMSKELRDAISKRMHEEHETNDSRWMRKCARYYLEDTERPEVIAQEIADLEAMIAIKREKLNAFESAKAAKAAAKVSQENAIEDIPILSIDEYIEKGAESFVLGEKSHPQDSDQDEHCSAFADQAMNVHPDMDRNDFIEKLKKRIIEMRVNTS